jgi:hypothetical protein
MSQIVEAKPESVGPSSQQLARIKPWMECYVPTAKLPGAIAGAAVFCNFQHGSPLQVFSRQP